jgi:hypothetical protein
MLSVSASALLLPLAGAFCLLAALALWRTVKGARRLRYGAVTWFDARRWPLLAWPALTGAGIGWLLTQAALPTPVQLALAALIGIGLVLLAATFYFQAHIVVNTEGVRAPARYLGWTAVDDYVETRAGLALFYRDGHGRRCRLTLPVPARHRGRVAQITSACLDARFDYAARVYAGRLAQEG